MAKKKIESESVNTAGDVVEVVIPTLIIPLSVDFPSEGLNNMAKKINELIEVHNQKFL